MESGDYANSPVYRTLSLNGAGQVIAVADTGLDIYSNYFYDNATITPDLTVPITNHRKIVSYTTKDANGVYGDFTDISEGHGSHGK